MRRYNTSIKELIQAKNLYKKENSNKEPIFLSDWDPDYSYIQIPHLYYNSNTPIDLQRYYFWTDESEYRSNIQNFFLKQFAKEIAKESFTIGSNGTSSIMLALTALKESGRKCALIVTPTYFSTLNLLDELDYEVVEYPLSMENNFKVDINKIEHLIKHSKIDILIITNPIFGSGVELDIEVIKGVSSICNTYGICLVMDYIYGGMPWQTLYPNYYIFNYPVYQAVSKTNEHIFIESISKRIFLNGAKFSLVFSSPDLMRRILRLSVFMVGSMASQQVKLIPQIYSDASISALTSLISENATKAYERFKLIQVILADKDIHISKANCGYFIILSIPNIKCLNDTTFAISLLNNSGVLTTPHSRYLYIEKDRYSFRVNLLLEKQVLIDGISKIRNLI